MSITIGKETVVVNKNIVLRAMHFLYLEDALSKEFRIEYRINGEDKFISLVGDQWNDFYKTWASGKQIIDLILEKEGIVIDIPIEEAEKQFVNVQEEPVVEEGA